VYTTRNSLYGTLGLDRVLSGPEARTILFRNKNLRYAFLLILSFKASVMIPDPDSLDRVLSQIISIKNKLSAYFVQIPKLWAAGALLQDV
jgi:hypothetical protein